MQIRSSFPGEEALISAFACRVFDAHMGPLDTPECRAAFHRFASPEVMAARSATNPRWVALDGGTIVGMIEVRAQTHIAMLFVETAYQRSGIGRRLVEAAFGPATGWPALTVNSAPTAVGAYERWGFVAAAPIQTSPEGIVYVPMRRDADAGVAPDRSGAG